jgi:hypothetical protein
MAGLDPAIHGLQARALPASVDAREPARRHQGDGPALSGPRPPHLKEETTVAVDGAIHETAYFQPIRPGCEIFFIPDLEGG